MSRVQSKTSPRLIRYTEHDGKEKTRAKKRAGWKNLFYEQLCFVGALALFRTTVAVHIFTNTAIVYSKESLQRSIK